MQLDQLTHWRLQGEPDVFTETRDGEEWLVIDSDKAYRAGFSQVVHFDKPIKMVSLSAVASLYTAGGGLMLRLGVTPRSSEGLQSWSGWYGPDNGWSGEKAQVLRHTVRGLDTSLITVSLGARAPRAPRWPGKNLCRWRDVQLEVEYAGVDPEPTPGPEPEPDQGVPGEIAQALAEVRERLDKIDIYLALWDKAQEWVDEYNDNRYTDQD